MPALGVPFHSGRKSLTGWSSDLILPNMMARPTANVVIGLASDFDTISVLASAPPK